MTETRKLAAILVADVVGFSSVVDAVRCAIELQTGLFERNAGVSRDGRMEFRGGVHLGASSRRATAI